MTSSNPPPSMDASLLWQVLGERVERFITAWDAEPSPPDLAAHMSDVPVEQRRLTLIELIKIDLEYRWTRVASPRALEDYFRDFPELAQDIPVELIHEEFHVR